MNIKCLILIISFSLIGSISLFSQQCGERCNTEPYPSDYQGQMCWLLNELCYGVNFPKTDAPIKITNEVLESYLHFDFGDRNFYLSETDIPWGGNYFACSDGGIAQRWRMANPNIEKKYFPNPNSLNWEDLKNLTDQQLLNLSPAEKYDIFMGDRNFSCTKFELTNHGPYRPDKSDDNYCGFCNGARSAGVLMPEPTDNQVVYAGQGNDLFTHDAGFVSDKSIKLTFTPADIKGLAAASFFYNEKAYNIGLNYSEPQVKKVDPDAATFDIMLRMMLAHYKIPFFLDVMPNEEKWNETVLGYNRIILSTTHATANEISQRNNPNIVSVVSIALELFTQNEVDIFDINKPTKKIMANKILALKNKWVNSFQYRYKLYIDNNGKIIEGVWVKGNRKNQSAASAGDPRNWDFPSIDYIWMAQGTGYYDRYSINGVFQGDRNLHYIPVLYLCTLDKKRQQEIVADPDRFIAFKEVNAKQKSIQSEQPPTTFLKTSKIPK